MSNWNKRIRAAREAQKMTREMVVQKMQQFLPESEKAVTTRSLMSWEAGEREPRVTVGVALAKALGFEDVAARVCSLLAKLTSLTTVPTAWVHLH